MKKLTLLKGKALASLVLMCLFLAQGCKKDLLQPNSKDLQNGISITEAKAYFAKNLQKTVKPQKLMSSGSLNKDLTIEDALANKQPIWSKAYEKMISTGASVKVPIDFGDAIAVVSPKTNAGVPLSSLNYLFMYRDSVQAVHTEWIILYPDSTWLYGERSRYTGHIIVKDWGGKTIKKLFFSPISQINTSAHIKSKLLSSNGVTNSQAGEDQLDDVVGFCTRWPTGKCPKTGVCSVTCDGCLEVCAKLSCTLFDCSPECDLPSESGSGGGGGGGTINPSRPGGGGAYPPDNCGGGKQIPKPPITNPDNNSIPLPPCIPIPVRLEPNHDELIPTPTQEELEPLFLPANFDIEYTQEWYDTENELAALGIELMQQGVPDTDPIPEMYYKNGTGIDMRPANPKNGLTVKNAPRNKDYFWKELIAKRPEMFSQANRARLTLPKPLAPIIDDQWIKYNPTHKSYKFDKLIHHHDEQDYMAFAIPEKVHIKWTKILHDYKLRGKVPSLNGTLNTLISVVQIFSIVTDVRTTNPDAWINWFSQQNEKGKIYADPSNNKYWEIMDQTIYKNSSGVAVRAVVHYNVYADFVWDSDEHRYMGVIKLNEFTEDVDLINKTSKEVVRKWL